MKRTCILLPLLLSLMVLIPAQEVKSTSYQELVAKLKAGATDVDFTKLRDAYLAQPASEREEVRPELIATMWSTMKDKKPDRLIESATAILNADFINIDAHLACALAYKNKKNSEREQFHQRIAQGLLQSILSSGDGKGYKTAYIVIRVKEEFAIIKHLGLVRLGQYLHEVEGQHYHVINTINPKTDEKVSVYFNIDKFYQQSGK